MFDLLKLKWVYGYMGIDVFGTEGEKTEENPCRVLEPNQKPGHNSSNQAVA